MPPLHQSRAALTAEAEPRLLASKSLLTQEKKLFLVRNFMAAGWRLPDSRNLSDNLSGPPNTKEGTVIMEKEFKPDIYLLLNQWMTDLRPFLFRQKKFRFLSVFEFLHFRRNFRFFGFWRLREEGKFFWKNTPQILGAMFTHTTKCLLDFVCCLPPNISPQWWFLPSE